jgi:hypothetical protein
MLRVERTRCSCKGRYSVAELIDFDCAQLCADKNPIDMVMPLKVMLARQALPNGGQACRVAYFEAA